jgi:hypothetical protein
MGQLLWKETFYLSGQQHQQNKKRVPYHNDSASSVRTQQSVHTGQAGTLRVFLELF